jgi:hypothetical protein
VNKEISLKCGTCETTNIITFEQDGYGGVHVSCVGTYFHTIDEEPIVRHPQSQVLGVLDRCKPIVSDERVVDLLGDLGVVAEEVDKYSYARLLPVKIAMPSWVQPWQAEGFQLVVPAYSYSGRMESVQALHINPETGGVTYRWPSGAHARELIFLNRSAIYMMRGDATLAGRLIITNDVMEWLFLCTKLLEECSMVMCVPGSWNDRVASKITSGLNVVIYCKKDTGLAVDIKKTLRFRCNIHHLNSVEKSAEQREDEQPVRTENCEQSPAP